MRWMIEAHGLTKNYPAGAGWRELLGPRSLGPCVVDHVDLAVQRGELFGLVGPNGAGKTTLIKLLTTLVVPTAGSVRIAGHDIHEEQEIKKVIGLASSDERSFYWRLTGRQNLQFFASLHNMPASKQNGRIDTVLSQVGLQEMAHRRFHTYSTGMRQRLAIARALLTEPRVIFMDEPTSGLDPAASNQLHRLIREHLIGHLGITVFLTSHHLTEVEKICDRIAIMHKGRIRACGTMAHLRKLIGPVEQYRVEVQDLDQRAAAEIVRRDTNIKLIAGAENAVRFEFDNEHVDDRLGKLLSAIQAHKGRLTSVACVPVSLDVVFEHLTGWSGPDPSDGNLKHASQPMMALQASDSPSVGEEESSAPAASNPGRRRSRWRDWITSKLRTAKALTKRDMLSETSYRLSFMMQIVEIFLTVTALFFISRMVGQDAVHQYLAPYGGNYFAFAIIGVAFYGYFNVGFAQFADQLREAQTTGTLEAMLSTPAGLSTIVLGSSVWKFTMTTLRVAAILVSGTLLLDSGMSTGSWPLVLLILFLTILSASSFGIIAACFIIVTKRGDPISWLFKSASWLLGGVVFPVSMLPSWMQKLALLLPTTHALRAMRLALLQGKSLHELLPEIGALCVFCFLLLPISLRTLTYSVRRSKIEGTLTHY
jgi:ABC-type multidrug transport system ATPase subunit/ABC-type polysaccharide/polyol phosphate export permease